MWECGVWGWLASVFSVADEVRANLNFACTVIRHTIQQSLGKSRAAWACFTGMLSHGFRLCGRQQQQQLQHAVAILFSPAAEPYNALSIENIAVATPLLF